MGAVLRNNKLEGPQKALLNIIKCGEAIMEIFLIFLLPLFFFSCPPPAQVGNCTGSSLKGGRDSVGGIPVVNSHREG